MTFKINEEEKLSLFQMLTKKNGSALESILMNLSWIFLLLLASPVLLVVGVINAFKFVWGKIKWQ